MKAFFAAVALLVTVFSLAAVVAIADSDADRFSYLDILSDNDLAQYLQEQSIRLVGSENRKDLLQKVIAVEKEKERVESAGGSRDGSGHILDVRFCTSCGYADQFSLLAKLVNRRLPKLDIKSGNKEPSATGRLIGSITQYGTIYSVVIIVMGQLLAGKHPLAPFIAENRMPIFMAGYLLSVIGGQALATGAFEVAIDGQLFYSKLETGRMPDMHQLADAIVASIQKGVQQKYN